MADWDGAEALFCRRDTTKTRVEDEYHNLWLPAVVEVLDARPQEGAAPGQVLAATDLRTRSYFDSGFLALVLSDVLPEVGDLEELELPDALDRIDRKLSTIGLTPRGDVSWTDRIGAVTTESTCRLYAGLSSCFAAVLAGEGRFELVFVSELGDGTWIVTGLADDLDARIASRGPDGLPVPHPRVQLQAMDESLPEIVAAHKASLLKPTSPPVPAPANLEEAVAALERFLKVALG